MSKNLLIAGGIGVVLFVLFIIMLMFTIGEKNKEIKPTIAEKPSIAPQITQNQTLQIESQVESKPASELTLENKTFEKTKNQTSKTIATKKIKRIAKSKFKKKYKCVDDINYIICENGICNTKGVICGKIKEITINSIIYQKTSNFNK